MLRPKILVLAFAAAAASPLAAQTPDTCTVAHVLDGDTLHCADGRRVRLLLVDAPDAGRFGSVARRALATLTPAGTQITLETDAVPKDSDGRTLAYVWIGTDRMVNQVLVREGFAFFKPSRENQRYAELLRAAEREARNEHRGVWTR